MQKLVPFLWFDNQAEEATKFYTGIFPKSKLGRVQRYDEAGAKVSGRPAGSVMTIDFKINGQDFAALNGGPIFKFTPAISFFIYCTRTEIDSLYNKLVQGGEVLMALDKYPWSERYAFIKDKYGVSWQLIVAKKQPITPSLLFVGSKMGKAEAAIKFYTKVFKKAKIKHIERYPEGSPAPGTVMYSSFLLEGQPFTAMDGPGPHQFDFNEATSFVINCKDQKELDYYWNKLTKGGDPKAQVCGWLKDKFGVSWQVVPVDWNKWVASKDKKKVGRMMEAMFKMKKLDIKALKRAFDGK